MWYVCGPSLSSHPLAALAAPLGEILTWQQVARSIEANVACPRECWDWVSAMEPHLEAPDLAPHAIYSFGLEVSFLLPRILRAVKAAPSPSAQRSSSDA